MTYNKDKLKQSLGSMKLTGTLFGETGESVEQIPLADLEDFPQHPFHVLEDQGMEDLKESIAEHGVLHPIIVREKGNGKYEIIGGHRRRKASMLLGLREIPAMIRQLDDEEAVLFMVDSNIQREQLLPSEKAFAYKMKFEALKKRTAKAKTNGDPLGHQSTNQNGDPLGHPVKKKTRELLAENSQDSGVQIQRYLRLTELCSQLLQQVDTKKLPFQVAVDLSYLTLEEQKTLVKFMEEYRCSITLDQGKTLKHHSQAENLTEEIFRYVLGEEKSKVKKTTFRLEVEKYFPPNTSKKEMELQIVQLLSQWKLNSETE